MNRKKGKQQKMISSSSIKIDSGQEVLVLPPNLLQKLGINLGKVCGTQDSSVVLNGDVPNNMAPPLVNEIIEQKTVSAGKIKESSIVETAHLMKKSVFLSPTFNLPESVALPNNLGLENMSLEKLCEENVALDKNENNKIENKGDSDDTIDYCIDNQNLMAQYSQDSQSTVTINSTVKPSINEEGTKSVNKSKINILSEEIVSPTKLRPLIDVNNQTALVPIPIDTFISVGKHPKYSKKTFNNNRHTFNNKFITITSPDLNTVYNEGVIIESAKIEETNGEISHNHITENVRDSEILMCYDENNPDKTTSAEYDDVKSFPNIKPQLKNYTSIEGKNTCKHKQVAAKKIYEAPNVQNPMESKANQEGSNLQSGTSVTEIVKDTEILTSIDENISEKIISVKYDDLKSFQDCTTYPKNLTSMEESNIRKEVVINSTNNKSCKDPNVMKANQEGMDVQSGASANKNPLDTVETIAKMLFQHLKKDKRSNFDKSSAKEKVFTPQQSKVMTKLSIQGVEKPGGDDMINGSREQYTRTYARNRKISIAKKYLNLTYPAAHLDKTDSQIDCDKNVSYTPVKICKQFCVCFDFGYLDVSVNFEDYLHPHFSNSGNCFKLHDALSIYTEDENIINRVECDDINLEKTEFESDSSYVICYNGLYLDSDIEKEYLDSNKSVLNESSDKTNHDDSIQLAQDQKKPAQISPEVQTVQNMRLHGFETSDIDLDSEKGTDGVVKLIGKKRKLRLSDGMESKTDGAKRLKRRKSQPVANEKLEPLSRVKKHKIKDNENLNNSEATEVSLSGMAPAAPEREVRCALCGATVRADSWLSHAAGHAYLAWADGDTPLDITDKKAVRKHLLNICNELGTLTCSKCMIEDKNVNSFLSHTKQCKKYAESTNKLLDSSIDRAADAVGGGGAANEVGVAGAVGVANVQCGVCDARLRRDEWMTHAAHAHNYLTWIHGQPKLDLENKAAIYDHLYRISKEIGGLLCGGCGRRRKYVKAYLTHVDACKGAEAVDSSVNDTLNESTALVNTTVDGANTSIDSNVSIKKDDTIDVGVAVCGVCGVGVAAAAWREHARTQHAYLAWIHGQTPLALDKEEEVYNHLHKINKKQRGLKCNKCGRTKKSVKLYLTHVRTCGADSLQDSAEDTNLDAFECAVCGEKVKPTRWTDHAMDKHYNIAWVVGETPIDLKNPSAAEKYLKDYKHRHNKLKCKVCGLVRVSCAGFYAHIIQCGKSDEETEIYKSVCEICNNKYLCVYKSQHLTMHREKEKSKHNKLLEMEKMRVQEPAQETGRRRAAEKAKTVIAKYKMSIGDEEANEVDEGAGQDSDTSAQIDSASSSSDSESAADSSPDSEQSEILGQQNKRKKKKKYPESHTSNIKRVPFNVKNMKTFIAESVDDCRKLYLCAGVLYPQWRRSEITPVPAEQAQLFMPTLEQSCKVMIDANQWTTYKLFEARVGKEISFFVGGCIQWISWAPPRVNDDKCNSFLAVAAHREADTPRLDVSSVYQHPAVVQIWDFGDMTTAPKLSLCIALECGTIWAGAWCPSGARDVAAPRARLGLLAVASSSGAAYILSVPYPDAAVDSDKLLYKIKPVAELRYSRGDREKYQATSITWSPERGHSVVVVGYADGSVGYYNIDCTSPLLTDEEEGVTIFYPYDEEQRHYSCITDLEWVAEGGVASASQTGGSFKLRGATVRSLLPAARVTALPHWPAAVVAGNDLIVNQTVNELDCWGAGRRLGSLQCVGGCQCCGAVAAVAAPALRVMRLHPAYGDYHKKDVAMIDMARLNNKKSKIKNDGLSVVIEPRTYEDAVKIYGVKFKHLTGKTTLPAVPCKDLPSERFPLAEAVGVAFCPAPAHHTYLAVALYCGIVVILNA